MAEGLKIEVKDLKRQFFRVRGRFLKLQRTVLGEALQEAAAPIIDLARQLAPKGSGKRSKTSLAYGPLATSIQAVPRKARGARASVAVTPARTKGGIPFYALFQERGWRATGRRKAGKAVHPRQIPGKHFLERAGKQGYAQAEKIFAARIFQRFDEMREAGEALGL